MKKHKHRVPNTKGRDPGWVICGFDTSHSCMAGAAVGYDRTLNKYKGPVFTIERWASDTDYFQRIRRGAYSYELVLELIHKLGLIGMKSENVYIAQEEPWPFGLAGATKSFTSSYLKQQAEISGAFVAGLLRFGYANVVQMNSMRWRKMIADDLGITTHHTKWKNPDFVKTYNCLPKDTGKFRAKEWALRGVPSLFPNEIPDLPDIITSKSGNIPRPEGSKARAIQPADEYDALAVMWAFMLELQEGNLLAAAA